MLPCISGRHLDHRFTREKSAEKVSKMVCNGRMYSFVFGEISRSSLCEEPRNDGSFFSSFRPSCNEGEISSIHGQRYPYLHFRTSFRPSFYEGEICLKDGETVCVGKKYSFVFGEISRSSLCEESRNDGSLFSSFRPLFYEGEIFFNGGDVYLLIDSCKKSNLYFCNS
jgi:hypothetical protein